MANSRNKRKKYSRKEPFASLRKKRSIVPIREEDDHASAADATPESAIVAEVDEVALSVAEAPTTASSDSDTAVVGRRIVDINYFLQQLHENFDHHDISLGCSFSHLKLVGSWDQGLRTHLRFLCDNCGYTFSIWTDPDHKNIMGINRSAVCGTITSGTGHSTLQEQLAAMSIPGMNARTYQKCRDTLFDNFHEVAEAERERAVAIERDIAIQKGHVIGGIPYIDVIADGCWAKRSYAGGKHDALSGAAMIFGRESKLALFVGVRNKYCAAHAKAEITNSEPSPHICYKNWGRDRSSNAMETDIILEGFRTSIESNGLIYKTLIADGDSSVYQAIRDENPYSEYGVTVDKLECNNHLFRNMCRKFRMASVMKLSTAPSREILTVTQFRQYVLASGLKIRVNVEKARDLCNVESASEVDKTTRLCEYILVIFSHVFGDHSGCQVLPFECSPQPTDKNVLPELHRTGIYAYVYEAVRYLSCHAKSLLRNVNNNMAEGCNSIVNKLNSGKRINHCLRNSYQMRCYGAVVQYNTQSVLSKVHQNRCHRVPRTVAKLETRRRRHNQLRRLTKSRKRNRRQHRGVDKDYGPSAMKPDIDKDVFDVLASQHMAKLKAYQNNWQQIERDTTSQSDSELWNRLRTEIITASRFGPICRMLPTTSCANMVASIRFPKVVDTAATQFGIANEANAKRDVELKAGIKIAPCGLFIDQEIPYLGASPDGLIDGDGLVEIKCPFSAQDAALDHVINERPNLRNIFDKKDKNLLNRNHVYFYQVQGQLHVTKREYCIFALWTSIDLKLVTVVRDDEFWQTKMQPFLCRFYTECLLPEIVDSRRNRNMRIRDPEYILEAKEAALRKKRARCIGESDDTVNCTDSQNIVVQASAAENNASLHSKNTAGSSSKNSKATAEADWIVITNVDDMEVSDQNLEIIEIVRRGVSVEEVEENVLSPNSMLTDSSIDLFQNILQENSCFRCDPACYTAYYNCIKPCSPLEKDVQIIGGNACRHWCCVYYDGSVLYIYDSLVRGEYEVLSIEEKRYVAKRYPHIDAQDIILQPVTRQPDFSSCGVYAAAFATTVALGGDPVHENYSRDGQVMRAHLMKVLKSRELIPFPCG